MALYPEKRPFSHKTKGYRNYGLGETLKVECNQCLKKDVPGVMVRTLELGIVHETCALDYTIIGTLSIAKIGKFRQGSK